MSDVLKRTLERERAARKQAEALLESKSRELFEANRELESHVADYDIKRLPFHQFKSSSSPGGEFNIPFFSVPPQLPPQRVQNKGIVINKQE